MKIRSIAIILISLVMIVFTGCSGAVSSEDNQYISMVKNGHPNSYPNSTYGESFESFFGSPTWKYFESDDGRDIVEFTGNCTYQNVEVKAIQQFILDVDNGTFEAGALSFNDVPQNQLITGALLSKVFEDNSTDQQDTETNQVESVDENEEVQE